jgi:hypothetical protein
MVWARALWDIRSLLISDPAWGNTKGSDMADHLALQGYFPCHGFNINFLIAANGIIDSARKTSTLSAALVDQMETAFRNRNIM